MLTTPSCVPAVGGFEDTGAKIDPEDVALTMDLEIGDYTVTELTDWSFRYEVVNAEKSISLAVDGSKNVVSFGHVRSFKKWLDGNHSITNIFS